MTQISAEQALQIPQQLKQRESKAGDGTGQGTGSEANSSAANTIRDKRYLGDDPVTLAMINAQGKNKRVTVASYKNELGQVNTFVKDTLKNKLSEYGLGSQTPLELRKNMFGSIEVSGQIPPQIIKNLEGDLNRSQHFKGAFNRLSEQSPTLSYVDNVVKISQAYGANNSVFNSLISENDENNRLHDIAHRYRSLMNQAPGVETNTPASESSSEFVFYFN